MTPALSGWETPKEAAAMTAHTVRQYAVRFNLKPAGVMDIKEMFEAVAEHIEKMWKEEDPKPQQGGPA